YYQKLGYEKGLCPVAEKYYERIISLPLFPDLSQVQQDFVVEKVREILEKVV
ncbi:MAG: DegT/DnrJ/EryC1/StrS aminotransferase family protein, partial [Ignavibacteriales bacterium]|nr:DegT/DnrJ/EryC1/StrS aminotransferase family protein [Ignavibacteriales bacterium]